MAEPGNAGELEGKIGVDVRGGVSGGNQKAELVLILGGGARTSGLFAAVDDEGQVTHAAAEHAEGGERIIVTEIRW